MSGASLPRCLGILIQGPVTLISLRGRVFVAVKLRLCGESIQVSPKFKGKCAYKREGEVEQRRKRRREIGSEERRGRKRRLRGRKVGIWGKGRDEMKGGRKRRVRRGGGRGGEEKRGKEEVGRRK